MKSPMPALALTLVLLAVIHVTPTEARRKTVVHRGPHRTTIVVHRGFPVRRAFPPVVVRPARARVALVAPLVYLPLVPWRPVAVVAPARDLIVWEDSETFDKSEEWTEISLGVHDRGSALYLEVEGKARLDFAEIVFSNGDTQVVDFNRHKVEKGHFLLLNFKDGRSVSHVRLLAKAESETARVVLRMEK